MRKLINTTILFSAAVLLFSCSYDLEDIDENIDTDDRSYILFAPMHVTTRAARATSGTLSSYGVSCSIYDQSSSFNASRLGSYFYNLKIQADSGTCGYPWPGERYKVSFFAYAPYGNEALSISSSATKGRPVYSYTVPSDVSKQLDFMTTEITDISGKATAEPVKLTFNHCLSDVTFSVFNKGYDDIIIHSISILGVRYKGTFNGTWSLDNDVNSSTSHPFTLYITDGKVKGQDTRDMSEETDHMMLLPQRVPGGTQFISVDATINNERKTHVYTLPSDYAFEIGKSYNFKISIGTIYISVDTESEVKDWEAETKYLTVSGVDTDNRFSQPSLEDENVVVVPDWEKE